MGTSKGDEMATRESVPRGAPCWIDLWTSDVEGSREFYSRLFGWRAGEGSPEFGGYFMFFRGEEPIAGGMGDMGDAPADDTWKVYLDVADVPAAVARAEARGARVLAPVGAVATLGVQCVLSTPDGAVVGLWHGLDFAGFATTGEAGAPCWFEHHSRDFAALATFYRDVAELDVISMSDTDDFRYATLNSQGEEVGGLFDATARLGEAPAHWSIYFQVDDVDVSAALVRELGGSVLDEPFDSPYGRIAKVSDPTGAAFLLMRPTGA